MGVQMRVWVRMQVRVLGRVRRREQVCAWHTCTLGARRGGADSCPHHPTNHSCPRQTYYRLDVCLTNGRLTNGREHAHPCHRCGRS